MSGKDRGKSSLNVARRRLTETTVCVILSPTLILVADIILFRFMSQTFHFNLKSGRKKKKTFFVCVCVGSAHLSTVKRRLKVVSLSSQLLLTISFRNNKVINQKEANFFNNNVLTHIHTHIHTHIAHGDDDNGLRIAKIQPRINISVSSLEVPLRAKAF